MSNEPEWLILEGRAYRRCYEVGHVRVINPDWPNGDDQLLLEARGYVAGFISRREAIGLDTSAARNLLDRIDEKASDARTIST